MTIYKKKISKSTVKTRVAHLRKSSSNSEVGVLIVKDISNKNISGRYGIKPIAKLKNKTMHKKFISNLLSAIPSKSPIPIEE